MFIHPNFGRILGAGHFAAAVTFAQDATAASASLEAAVAAAGAFVVLAGAGGMAYGWVTYKSLVELRKEMDRVSAEISDLLKQRIQALPALTTICAAYLQDEPRYLLGLDHSRSEWAVAQSMEERWKVGVISHLALKELFAACENHPALRAKESFARLQETLKGVEKQIAVRREQYNTAAGAFNARIKQFPDGWIASFADFKSRPMFAAPPEK
jgi:LemA protein